MAGRRAGDGLARAGRVRARRWMRRHRTAVASAVVAILMALAGTMAILAVQTRANRDLQVSNHALAAANRRERERFDLALEAIGLFHGQVSEDLLLKEKQFDILRTKLLRGAVAFYDRLGGLLESQTDPEFARRWAEPMRSSGT